MSDRVYRGLLVVCGVFPVGLGGFFYTQGFLLSTQIVKLQL